MSTVEFTSDVVRKTKFRDKMRGYHPDEVDAFLERAATALDVLQTRLTEVTERAMKAEAALETNSETDESIRRTLTLAQRTAEMAVAEAKDEAEHIRADAAAEAERVRTEAEEEARQQAAEADEARRAAEDAAARLVQQAEQEAQEAREASQSAIATAERESEQRIEAAQAEADAALARQADAARRELDAVVASLSGQRDELRGHVEALATYLAGERGRVLDALQSALDNFSSTLVMSERPAQVTAAFNAPLASIAATDETQVEGSSVELASTVEAPVDEPADEQVAASPLAGDTEGFVGDDDPAWMPRHEPWNDWAARAPEADEHPGPADVWFPDSQESIAPVEGVELVETPETVGAVEAGPDDGEGQPSSLLFRLEHELRRSEVDGNDDRVADKPRKAVLGRRRR